MTQACAACAAATLPSPTAPAEALADRARHRLERDQPAERREAAEQRRVRDSAPGVLARKLGGRHGQQPLAAEAPDEVAETELVEALGGVDQDEAVRLAAAEHVHLVQQRGVLDDQRVGLHHGLARADLVIVDAAERDHRRAHALGAEARERLRVAALVERGQREHLGGRHHALAAATMDAHLEHPLRLDARGVQQHALLGGGDEPAGALDGVDADRDRVDAGAHEQLGVLGVHRGSLAADRGAQPEPARAGDQLAQVGGDRRIALVEGLGQHLVVTVCAEQQLREVVGADRDAGDAEGGVLARG